jgi:hypothetical protein
MRKCISFRIKYGQEKNGLQRWDYNRKKSEFDREIK